MFYASYFMAYLGKFVPTNSAECGSFFHCRSESGFSATFHFKWGQIPVLNQHWFPFQCGCLHFKESFHVFSHDAIKCWLGTGIWTCAPAPMFSGLQFPMIMGDGSCSPATSGGPQIPHTWFNSCFQTWKKLLKDGMHVALWRGTDSYVMSWGAG